MKPAFSKFAIALGVILVGTLLSGTAFAACGDNGKSKPGASLLPQLWDGQSGSLLPVSASSSDDAIVGMWHVTFTAQGNEAGPPDGTPLDNALVVWHNDGTEIMNSARPPQDGDFCLGVWEKTGKSKYKLNHFAWLSNDTTNAPSGIGNPQGPTRFFEEITLSPDGKHYTGKLTLDAYDTSGNVVSHIVGVINATRITINTTVPDLL
ncbi:MAG TPA: hypothetical protein VGL74_11575 [Terriglobales bacterium]